MRYLVSRDPPLTPSGKALFIKFLKSQLLKNIFMMAFCLAESLVFLVVNSVSDFVLRSFYYRFWRKFGHVFSVMLSVPSSGKFHSYGIIIIHNLVLKMWEIVQHVIWSKPLYIWPEYLFGWFTQIDILFHW